MDEPLKFVLPRVLGSNDDTICVAPPKPRPTELGTIVTDLLGGELTAGIAVADWLKERLDDPERRNQYFAFVRLMRCLCVDSVQVAMRYDVPANWAMNRASMANRISREWETFCLKVRELFAFDLFEQGDLLRFVAEVMLPGKLGGYEEVA